MDSSRVFRAHIRVTFKSTVNDPESETITRALGRLGFGEIESLHAGKYFDMRLRADTLEDAEGRVQEMCEKLLTNPVIEQYRCELSAEE